MPRIHAKLAAWISAAAGILALCAGPAAPAETPYAGTWKATIHLPGQSVSLFLIQIEEKDGKPAGKVLATFDPKLKNGKVEQLKVDDKSMHLSVHVGDFEFAFVVYFPKDGARNKPLVGSVAAGNRRDFAELEKTDLQVLDPKTAVVPSAGLADAQKADQAKDRKQKDDAFKQFLEKHPEGPLAYAVRLQLLLDQAREGSPEAELRGNADKLVELSAPHGPEMKLHTLQSVSEILLGFDKSAPFAASYAKQAEQALDKNAPATQQVAVLKMLANALKKSGKANEAKEFKGRIATLEAVLDEEFAKKAIPFKPEAARPRPGENNRVVLLELFTGVMCPPCVAADVAFDAMLQSYRPADVVLLQYHMPIPGPDPLTNDDADSRFKFYRLEYTPTVLIDGNEVKEVGGGKADGETTYGKLVKALAGQFESKPSAQLKVSASQTAGKINIQTTVSDLKKPGESVRLHVVLVEEMVRFPGRNGQRLHHHVVRAFPGGVKGMALKEASAKRDLTVNVPDLQKSLNDYLASNKFDEDSRPLDLKHLKVVAFVQDEKTQEVMQAVQADVNES